jgi:hypothetical protein
MTADWLMPDRSCPCTGDVGAPPRVLEPDIDDLVASFTHISPAVVRAELQGVNLSELIRASVLHIVLPLKLLMEHMPSAPRPQAWATWLLWLAKCWRNLPSPPVRAALLAALTARNAAIDGDVEMVDAFARTWLGLSNPEAWREAVEMALLGDWVEVLNRGLANDEALAHVLRTETSIERRRLHPLWERRVRGKRVLLLSQEVGGGMLMQDLLVDCTTPEGLALASEVADERIACAMRDLRADEVSVARLWAHSGDTWAAAATAAGLPAVYGERVRRKLKRLGGKHAARRSAAAVTVVGA